MIILYESWNNTDCYKTCIQKQKHARKEDERKKKIKGGGGERRGCGTEGGGGRKGCVRKLTDEQRTRSEVRCCPLFASVFL